MKAIMTKMIGQFRTLDFFFLFAKNENSLKIIEEARAAASAEVNPLYPVYTDGMSVYDVATMYQYFHYGDRTENFKKNLKTSLFLEKGGG